MSGDIKKLPKWAQSEMRRLQANVSHLETKLSSMFTQKETAVEYEPYRGDGEKRLFLPDDSHIYFSVKGGKVQIRIQGDRLYLMGDSRMGHDLNIMPSSSNTLTIGFGK